MKKTNLTLLIILCFLSTSIIQAQEEEKPNYTLDETIDFIKEVGEDFNYDSNGDYLSKPFKNTKAYITFNELTGILKMSSMADYSGDWGESNFNIELNLKKIDPEWIRGYTNGLNDDYSGFVVKLPDDVRDNVLKEKGKFVKDTGIGNFKGDIGKRITKALKYACSLLYKESQVKKFKF